jgi:hypothetical protein
VQLANWKSPRSSVTFGKSIEVSEASPRKEPSPMDVTRGKLTEERYGRLARAYGSIVVTLGATNVSMFGDPSKRPAGR